MEMYKCLNLYRIYVPENDLVSTSKGRHIRKVDIHNLTVRHVLHSFFFLFCCLSYKQVHPFFHSLFVRSSVSSLNFQYPFLSLGSSSWRSSREGTTL